jgi:hypothetical protein
MMMTNVSYLDGRTIEMIKKKIATGILPFLLIFASACNLVMAPSGGDGNGASSQNPQVSIDTAVAQTKEAVNQVDLAIQQTLTALAPVPTATRPYSAEMETAFSWPLQASDPFNDGRYGWPTDSKSDASVTFSRTIQNGAYQIEYQTGKGQGSIVWNNPAQISAFDLTRFYVSVDASVGSSTGQGCVGFIFKNSDNQDFIYTCIFSDQRFKIYANVNHEYQKLATGTSDEIISGGMNKLTMIGLDGKFYLFINDSFVTRVESNVLHQGKINLLFGVAENDHTSITYDNFELRFPGTTAANNPVQPPASSAPTARVSEVTNCREGPAKAYDHVSDFNVGDVTEVVGKSSDGTYWVVKAPHHSGTCWLWGQTAIVTGDTTKLPVVEAPPLVAFEVSYNSTAQCGVPYYLKFYIENTGNIVLESIWIQVINNTTGITGTERRDVVTNPCGGGSYSKINPGETQLVSPAAPFMGPDKDPTGDDLTVIFNLCTENDLQGQCISKTISVTP